MGTGAVHSELIELYEADRRDHAVPRLVGTEDYAAMRSRDARRRERVFAMLAEGSVVEPIDLYRAAWVLNHGDRPEEAEAAYRLAERAAQGGCAEARWLYAASYDRWCMYSGRQQKFGTQFVPDGQGYRLWDIDPRTTDEERARFDVPTLAQQLRRAERDSVELPQPPMADAPPWLREKMARWADERDAEGQEQASRVTASGPESAAPPGGNG